MKNEETEFTGYNITKSIRMDELDLKKLKRIAIYERARLGALLRMWIHDKVLTYYQNPKFKRWLKQAYGEAPKQTYEEVKQGEVKKNNE